MKKIRITLICVIILIGALGLNNKVKAEVKSAAGMPTNIPTYNKVYNSDGTRAYDTRKNIRYNKWKILCKWSTSYRKL